MARKFPVTIYHNPKCGTSRGVIELVEAAGHTPEIVEYLKAGWTKKQLKELFAAAGLTPREAMRSNVPEAEELGFGRDGSASDPGEPSVCGYAERHAARAAKRARKGCALARRRQSR